MKRATIDGVELEYEVRGTGEPVILIHGAHLADSYLPLVHQSALAGMQMIRYHRRGYVGSTHTEGPMGVEGHAADAVGLLGTLGIERAHVVGHSSGALIALALALHHPEAVASLALLEPPSFAAPSAEAMFARLGSCVEAYEAGNPEEAVAVFLSAVFGLDRDTWLAMLDARVPGGFDQAVKDADTFFRSELPGVSAWTFGAEEGAKIGQPVLFVLGSGSEQWFVESRDLFGAWISQMEELTVEGTGHALQMQQPEAVAAGLAAFLARNPMGGS